MDITVDYRTLPPGRNRQLAYSYHIRTMLPLTSIRSNNRTFRIPMYERTRNWRNNRLYFGSIRTNIEREQRTFYTRVNLYDNYIDAESEYLIEDDWFEDIPNGDLSELTNELANLIIENQQNYDEQPYQQFDTEELPELETYADTEIDDTEIDTEIEYDNRLLNSPRLTVSPQTVTNFWPTDLRRHMRNSGTVPNTPHLTHLTPPEHPGPLEPGPLEPPGLEHFRGMFNHRENSTFNNLIDIEKGVISKNLVEKSKVVYYWDTQQNNTQQNNTPQNNTQQENIECLPFCSICRENFEYIDITRQLNCEHVFHINCIDTWFTKNKTCPECRYEI